MTDNGSHPFLAALALAWPPADWSPRTVLVAVSGGPDSVALLRGLQQLRKPGPGDLIVGHVNHHLRGEDSQADEAFVTDLAAQFGLRCLVEHLDPQSLIGRGTLEGSARQERYAQLTAMAHRCGARYLATAHTADDQAETILHHVLRGTGLAGLAGMPRARAMHDVSLIRPLLNTRRAVVHDYLRRIGQPTRQDPSNADPRFTRSRIRQELLPHLVNEYNPQVVSALLRLGSLASEAQAVLQRLAADLLGQVAEDRPGGGVRLDCRQLGAIERYLIREVLVALWQQRGWSRGAMGFAEWDALAELVTHTLGEDCRENSSLAPTSKALTLPGAIRVWRTSHWLEILPP